MQVIRSGSCVGLDKDVKVRPAGLFVCTRCKPASAQWNMLFHRCRGSVRFVVSAMLHLTRTDQEDGEDPFPKKIVSSRWAG